MTTKRPENTPRTGVFRERLRALQPAWAAALRGPSRAELTGLLWRLEDAVADLETRSEGNRRGLRELAEGVDETFDEIEGDAVLDMARAAELLHVSPRTVRRWVRQGRMPAIHVGPKGGRMLVRFSRDRLIEWIKRGGKRPGTSRFGSVAHAPGVPGRKE